MGKPCRFIRINLFLSLLLSVGFVLSSCQENSSFDQLNQGLLNPIPSGSIIVTSNINGTYGPGIISIWTPLGTLDRVIYDYTKNGIGFASGIGLLSNGYFLAVSPSGRNGSYDSLDLFNYYAPMAAPLSVFSSFYSAGGSIYLRNMALVQNIPTNRYYAFVAETGSSRVTRLSAPIVNDPRSLNFTRDFNFVNNGSCTLSGPYGVASIPNTDNIAVTDFSGNRLNLFNSAGTCITSVPAANTPVSVAYHEKSGKLLVVYAANSSIMAHNPTTAVASPATPIYIDATKLSTPKAIATDKDGYIYVSSDGLDQVIKLYWDGVTPTATYVGIAVGTSTFSQNITSLTVVP